VSSLPTHSVEGVARNHITDATASAARVLTHDRQVACQFHLRLQGTAAIGIAINATVANRLWSQFATRIMASVTIWLQVDKSDVLSCLVFNLCLLLKCTLQKEPIKHNMFDSFEALACVWSANEQPLAPANTSKQPTFKRPHANHNKQSQTTSNHHTQPQMITHNHKATMRTHTHTQPSTHTCTASIRTLAAPAGKGSSRTSGTQPVERNQPIASSNQHWDAINQTLTTFNRPANTTQTMCPHIRITTNNHKTHKCRASCCLMLPDSLITEVRHAA